LNALVYELYGLMEDEIAIVEGRAWGAGHLDRIDAQSSDSNADMPLIARLYLCCTWQPPTRSLLVKDSWTHCNLTLKYRLLIASICGAQEFDGFW